MSRRILSFLLLSALLLCALPVASSASAANYGLLKNAGFEYGFYNIGGQWNGRPLQVGNNWNLFTMSGSANFMDTRVFAAGGWVEKVEGDTSQFVFGNNSFYGGIYQQVNVKKGTAYSFGAALLPMWDRGNEGALKHKQVRFAIYTGIDPTGGTNPASQSIVWSPANNIDFAWNGKTTMVAAVAQADKITCFIKIENPDNGTYWETVIDGTYLNAAPTVAIDPVPAQTSTPAIPIHWNTNQVPDPVAGNGTIIGYDVRYKTDNGAWTDLMVDGHENSIVFPGQMNHEYLIQVRAIEKYGPGMSSLGAFDAAQVKVRVGAAPQQAPIGPAQRFAEFYNRYDGLRLLGNSLSNEMTVYGHQVQYFEKGRIEDHQGETSDPNWRFMYGLLVDELHQAKSQLPIGGNTSSLTYAGLHTLADASKRTAPPSGYPGYGAWTHNADGTTFVPFTSNLAAANGHEVPGYFWKYINRTDLFPGGWLHDIGLPVSDAVQVTVTKSLPGGTVQRTITVQAFQRTILTYDPANPAEWQIERANVGSDYIHANLMR